MVSKRKTKPMLPDIRQSKNYDCGDTALRIVCQFHKWRLPLSLTSNPIDGTDPRTIEATFRQTTARVVSGEMNLAMLDHFTRSGWPTIVLIQHDGVGHYVVAESVSRGSVRYQCPSRGPCKETYRKFLTAWNDVDRYGTIYRSWGLVAWEDGE